MKKTARIWLVCATLLTLLALPATPARAEIVEEIVAWVDGDIITRLDLMEAEQSLVQQLYEAYTGEQLDTELEKARAGLLQELIDQRILVRRAERLFDLESLGDHYLEQFMRANGFSNEADFEKALEQSGASVASFRRRMIDRFAPEQIIQMEVVNRVAVGDAEVAAYYAENPDEFVVEGRVTFREIVLLVEEGAEGENGREARRAALEALRDRIAAGEDFAELARANSDAGTAENGGLLGPLPRGDLSERLAGPLFSLPAGEMSEVMEFPYGFHLVQIQERQDTRQKTFEEVKEELRFQLEDRKYQAELEAFLQRARDEAEWTVAPKYRHRLAVADGS